MADSDGLADVENAATIQDLSLPSWHSTMRISSAVLALPLFLPITNGQEIDFAHEVVPILKAHCAECHTGEKSEGGFSFDTERKLKESGYVESGLPDQSRLIELISSTDKDDQMPPSDRKRLTDKEVATLAIWVKAGLTWEPGYRFSESAYEPPLLPRRVAVPTNDGGLNPIDRILFDYYQEYEIPLPEAVEGRTFLRRAFMDIIGIAPTPAEQDEYLRSSPNSLHSRSAIIDRLMQRKHDYAEHWISFWNDLLRNDYAGTGYIDGGRRQITSWLYSALLNNTPYNEFVRQLIAPDNDRSSGFINGIKWRGKVNASQIREIQFAQNVSQVFLGINMKCASCHDSFIDRWTLDEAYGLAAIYSTRELEIHRCDKPNGRIAKANWIFPELGNVDPEAEQHARLSQLADLLTSKRNGRFARTIANRIWHRLMGHGIVHPVDAMHTRPWNEDLLDFLANYLVDNGYDLKKLIRLIATSDAYRSQTIAARDSATTEEFVFRGPIARHLTSEQFIDAVWNIAHTAPSKIDAPIAAEEWYGSDIPDAQPMGRWIWTYADTRHSPAGEVAAFRKTLELPEKPARGRLIITCDNEYTAWINGKQVGKDSDWTTVESINIARQLRKGANEIVIAGRNAGASPNPAGLYAEVTLSYPDDRQQRLATDESWLSSRTIPAPSRLDDTTWTEARTVQPQPFPGSAVRKSISAEIARALQLSNRSGRAALMKSNLLMRSLGRPNREQVVTVRPASVSTLQAIDLANGRILDSMLSDAAERLHQEYRDADALVNRMFQSALCRLPSADEGKLAMELLGDSTSKQSIQDFLWLLVMLPEFQFVQ